MLSALLVSLLSSALLPQQVAGQPAVVPIPPAAQTAPAPTAIPQYFFAVFNGDGLVDVYVACQQASDQLHRNLGDGSFADVTQAVGLGGGSGSSLCLWQDI